MIKKSLLVLLLFIGCYSCVNAQALTKEDIDHSDIYFLKNSGELVAIKDSANFIRIISAPDTIIRNAFLVRDFYINGKPKMVGRTLTPDVYLKRQGPFVEYYPDGRRKTIENYENGVLAGDAEHYYPNGKLYYVSSYDKLKNLYNIREARDSSGAVTVENGNGKWIIYNDNFKIITGQGVLVKGFKEGEWSGTFQDSIKYVCIYKDGKGTTGTSYLPSGKTIQFAEAEIEPVFKSGIGAFYKFLGNNIKYPLVAKENNIQGKVYLTFVIERDGKLTDIKVLRGIGSGCDEEALRVLKISPPWNPGLLYGIPVRVKYQVPVNFALQFDN